MLCHDAVGSVPCSVWRVLPNPLDLEARLHVHCVLASSLQVETLLGDPTKAKKMLGWMPATTLEELISEMIQTDKEEAKKEALLKEQGFHVVGSMENPPANLERIESSAIRAADQEQK